MCISGRLACIPLQYYDARSADRARPTAPRPHTMAAYWHFVIMIVGGIETMWLGSLHTRNLIKWEPIWCVAERSRIWRERSKCLVVA